MKKALIFGVSGQAGMSLAAQLLLQGYYVTGTYNKNKPVGFEKEAFGCTQLDFRFAASSSFVRKMIAHHRPDEVYNLASIMFAPASWDAPQDVLHINGSFVVDILEAIRQHSPSSRFVQAGSADGEFVPRTPYGLAKQLASDTVIMYRNERGLHASVAILYNMESPRRSPFFFSQKVVRNVVAENYPFEMGDLSAVRDWGWTPDYMEALQLMARAETPDDYTIATGQSHTCKEFVVKALSCWGVQDAISNFTKYCVVKSGAVAPPVVPDMYASMGALAKTKSKLGWEAQHKFADVVALLVDAERKRVART